MNSKAIIIINGRGGAGKDTICKIVEQNYSARTVSAITPIKEFASLAGWKGEKDLKSRKFLSDLKQTFISYNDLPFSYLKSEINNFLNDDFNILFIHIREATEIAKVKTYLADKTKCITLCIIKQDNLSFGNTADDDFDKYMYDYYFMNESPLETLESDVVAFFDSLFSNESIVVNRRKNE